MKLTVSKILGTSYNAAKNLVVKVLGRGAIVDGRGDFKQVKEAGPFGMDSRPTEDKRCLVAFSEVYGKYYVIGTLNTDRLAAVGETRLFCTDANGEFKFNVWLQADGTVLMGDSIVPAAYIDFAVKYNSLKLEYDKTKLYLTTLRTATQTALVAVDGVVPGTSAAFIATMGVLQPGDISSSKNEKIKYPT